MAIVIHVNVEHTVTKGSGICLISLLFPVLFLIKIHYKLIGIRWLFYKTGLFFLKIRDMADTNLLEHTLGLDIWVGTVTIYPYSWIYITIRNYCCCIRLCSCENRLKPRYCKKKVGVPKVLKFRFKFCNT